MAKTIGSVPENVNFGIKASTVKQFLNSSDYRQSGMREIRKGVIKKYLR